MKKILLVFFALLSLPIFSQNYLDLYKDYIPEKILNDNILSKALELNLERNVLLNPELIYLTLKFYQQYDKSNFNIESFEMLKSNERIWLMERTAWAKKNIQQIKSTNNQDFIYAVEKPFKDILLDIQLKGTDKLLVLENEEKRFSEFLIVKLYNNDSDMKFDGNINYSMIRTQLEESKKQYFTDFLNNIRFASSLNEIIENAINNWYILLDDKIDLIDLLEKKLDYVKNDETRKVFFIFAGNVLFNNTMKFTDKIALPAFNYVLELENSDVFHQFSYGFGYRQYFNKKSFLFSYLDLQAVYSQSYSEINQKVQQVIYSYSEFDGNYLIQENLRNFNDSYKLSSLLTYGIQISVPIYKIYFISFQAAIGCYFNSYEYEPDIYFYYSKYRTEYNTEGQPIYRETLLSGSTTINQKVKKEYFSFLPIIDINLDILFGFGIKVSGSYNYLALNAFYKTALFF